jgi:hypothetical protein
VADYQAMEAAVEEVLLLAPVAAAGASSQQQVNELSRKVLSTEIGRYTFVSENYPS